MFHQIFGELATGRLARGPYFKYTALLSIFVVALVLYAASVLFVDVQETQFDWRDLRNLSNLRDGPELDIWGSLTYDMMLFGALIIFANFNLAVKRIRDVGLPVHWMLLGLFFTYAYSPVLFFGVLEMTLLVLTVLPSDMVASPTPARPSSCTP